MDLLWDFSRRLEIPVKNVKGLTFVTDYPPLRLGFVTENRALSEKR